MNITSYVTLKKYYYHGEYINVVYGSTNPTLRYLLKGNSPARAVHARFSEDRSETAQYHRIVSVVTLGVCAVSSDRALDRTTFLVFFGYNYGIVLNVVMYFI